MEVLGIAFGFLKKDNNELLFKDKGLECPFFGDTNNALNMLGDQIYWKT